MKGTPSLKHLTANWGDDERYSIRDCVGMDGKWQYQPVYGGVSTCGSVGASTLSFRSPVDNRLTSAAGGCRLGAGLLAWPGNGPR